MGENGFAALPVALYGFIQIMAGFAYAILARRLVASHGRDSTIGRAIGADIKGTVSLAVYAVAVPSPS